MTLHPQPPTTEPINFALPDSSFEDPSFGANCDGEETVEQDATQSASDDVTEAAINTLLLEMADLDLEFADVVRSRVVGDIFHLHHQIPISTHHGLKRPFHLALSAALFIPDPEDKAAIEAVLTKQGSSWSSKLRSKPVWVLKCVRRYVPPPEVLLPRVSAVIKTFGPLKDATTGAPLFNKRACEITKNILENVRLGNYSDPPNVQLYYETGHDKNGLTLYRCCRGTNDVEGGIHQNLIRRFTSFNISPRHAVNLLLDYVTCHNMQVIPLPLCLHNIAESSSRWEH